MTTQAIHVRGLEKSYGELRVLRGVDFGVAPGSVFALLGSKGSSPHKPKTHIEMILKP
jgi:ABC-2 type transport system ATP-binding protein